MGQERGRDEISESPELAEARRQGRIAGEEFDLALREQEKEERLGLVAAAASGTSTGISENAGDAMTSLAVMRLRKEVEQLAFFQRAVVNSKAWRLTQFLRRPFGREWPQRG